MRDTDRPSGLMPDEYDRTLDSLLHQQAVDRRGPAQIRSTPVFGIGGSKSYSVSTFRIAGDILEEDPETGAVKRGPSRFISFVEVAQGEKLKRVIFPDEVLRLMARQQESLTQKAAQRSARQAAKTRKERGIEPGFLKHKKK